jgi:hypothetical protein
LSVGKRSRLVAFFYQFDLETGEEIWKISRISFRRRNFYFNPASHENYEEVFQYKSISDSTGAPK